MDFIGMGVQCVWPYAERSALLHLPCDSSNSTMLFAAINAAKATSAPHHGHGQMPLNFADMSITGSTD